MQRGAFLLTEINLFPKFIDKAISPVAESVGQTLSSIWDIVFGGVDFYSEKTNLKREQSLADFKNTIDENISSIPPDKLVEPELYIVGPTLEASKYYFENKALRDMFANLLASSMHIDLKDETHPSFVEIIKQLSPDEAKLLQNIDGSSPISIVKVRIYGSKKDAKGNYHFSEPLTDFSTLPYDIECVYPYLGPSYLKNLSRLGLVDLSYDVYNINDNAYNDVEQHPLIEEWKEKALILESRFQLYPGAMTQTAFGERFFNSCILSQ